MKQKTNKTLLLLPCAVIAALIGTMTYFACSADDDWEGSPEYLKTHAAMLTRAGVDVGGGVDGDTIYNLLYINSFSQCTADASMSGINGTATFTLSTVEGRLVNNSKFSVNVNLPSSCMGPGYTTYTLINKSAPEYEVPTVHESYPNASVSIGTTATGKYRRERYVNGQFTADTIYPEFVFSVDLTNYTEWEKIY